jgi:peptidoglycan lytic transglycosylase
MPLGRMIGVSLALMVISFGAVAKTTDKGTAGLHSRSGAKHGKHNPLVRSRHAAAAALRHRRRAEPDEAADADEADAKPADSYLGPMHPVGAQEIGNAAWYGFEGGRTATGERLDGFSATAAHRSLPLNSYAKVTNLDNGRSIVVKINDRGPVSRRFVIDLSRPAARQLGIGSVAAVAVEALAPGAATPEATHPKIAAYAAP